MQFRKRKKSDWNPSAVEKRWRESEESGQKSFEKIFPNRPLESRNGFYDLCLSELDAIRQLNSKRFWISKEVYLCELRNLQAEPTQPSLLPFSEEGYREAQKWWIDHMILEVDFLPKPKSWKERWVAITALIFLGAGCWLMKLTFGESDAERFGLTQWQCVMAFLFCFVIFGLLGKRLARD